MSENNYPQWKKNVITYLQDLIEDIKNDNSPEDALLDVEKVYSNVQDILSDEIEEDGE